MNMMSTGLIDRLTNRPAEPRVAALPANATALQETRNALADHQTALARLCGAYDQTDAEIADVLLARSLGEKIDSRALLALTTKRDELTATIEQEQTIVAGLQARIRAWDAAEGRRNFDAAAAEMKALSAAAGERERRYEALAIELTDLAAEMRRSERRFGQLALAARNLGERYGFSLPPCRGPHGAPVITASYFRNPTSQASYRRHFAGWRKNRPTWGQEEPS